MSWLRSTTRASAAGSATTADFYPTQLRPTLIRIDAYVVRWARRKFKCATSPEVFESGLLRYARLRLPVRTTGSYAMATAGYRGAVRLERVMHGFWGTPPGNSSTARPRSVSLPRE